MSTESQSPRATIPDGRQPPAIGVLWTEDIALILERSTAAVTELFRLGKLPGRKVGRRWCCPQSTFERWLAGEDVER